MASDPVDEKPDRQAWGEVVLCVLETNLAMGASPQAGDAVGGWPALGGLSPCCCGLCQCRRGAPVQGGAAAHWAAWDLTSKGLCVARSLSLLNPLSFYRNGRTETNNEDKPVSSVF